MSICHHQCRQQMERHEQIPARYLPPGNGGNMMGNFFSNIGKGNVSGLSLIGLVVAALLVFGRFGWMGKIAGAVLAMMMIGNNVNMNEALASEKKRPAAQSQDEIQQSEIAQGTGGGRRR